LRQAQPRAQLKLAASHTPRIQLMIVARHVEQAVEDQYLELLTKGVAARDALPPRRFHADSQVSGNFLFLLTLEQFLGWERKNVSGFVLAAISPIQTPDRSIGGQ
jgi:hypothetical protein